MDIYGNPQVCENGHQVLYPLTDLCQWLKVNAGWNASAQLIASGYEWVCPVCYHINLTQQVTGTEACNNCNAEIEISL
jgi:hypothetical protein